MFILLFGFQTPKLAGITKAGKVKIFSPEEAHKYESPKTEIQRKECIKFGRLLFEEARDEYLTLGEFGALDCPEEMVMRLAKRPDLYEVMIRVLNGEEDLPVKNCRYCGRYFVPKTSWQTVCSSKDCQWQRQYNNMKSCRSRKKKSSR